MTDGFRFKPKSKAERSRQRRLLSHVEATGVYDRTSGMYILLRGRDSDAPSRNQPVLIPLADCQDQRRIGPLLGQAGIPLPTAERKQAVMTKISDVQTFEEASIVPYPGHYCGMYALPSGAILGPYGDDQTTTADGEPVEREQPLLGYQFREHRNKRSGLRKKGLAELGALLVDQDIFTLWLAAGLAPPLMRWAPEIDSFAIQLIGPSASGKSAATKLAASAYGRPSVEVHSTNLLENGHLETILNECNYQPFLVDGCERLFALGGPKQKLEVIGELDKVFHHELPRLGGTVITSMRTIALLTSQQPIEDLCGDDHAVRNRLGNRLLTIEVPEDRKGKVVADVFNDGGDRIPSRQVIAKLTTLATSNYGHLARRMIKGLLKAASKDEDGLRARVTALIDEFISSVGIDEEDGQARVTAARFGLISAAAQLGKEFGAFPKDVDVARAIESCYAMYRGANTNVPFESRLRDLLSHPRSLDLGSGSLPKVKRKQHEQTQVYIRRTKSETLLYIRPESIRAVFPDWPSIKSFSEVQALMKIDKGKRKDGTTRIHNMPKCALGKGRKPQRVYCFCLPVG